MTPEQEMEMRDRVRKHHERMSNEEYLARRRAMADADAAVVGYTGAVITAKRNMQLWPADPKMRSQYEEAEAALKEALHEADLMAIAFYGE